MLWPMYTRSNEPSAYADRSVIEWYRYDTGPSGVSISGSATRVPGDQIALVDRVPVVVGQVDDHEPLERDTGSPCAPSRRARAYLCVPPRSRMRAALGRLWMNAHRLVWIECPSGVKRTSKRNSLGSAHLLDHALAVQPARAEPMLEVGAPGRIRFAPQHHVVRNAHGLLGRQIPERAPGRRASGIGGPSSADARTSAARPATERGASARGPGARRQARTETVRCRARAAEATREQSESGTFDLRVGTRGPREAARDSP